MLLPAVLYKDAPAPSHVQQPPAAAAVFAVVGLAQLKSPKVRHRCVLRVVVTDVVLDVVLDDIFKRARVLLDFGDQIPVARSLAHGAPLRVAPCTQGRARDRTLPHRVHCPVAAERCFCHVRLAFNIGKRAADLHGCAPAAHSSHPAGVRARARTLLFLRLWELRH